MSDKINLAELRRRIGVTTWIGTSSPGLDALLTLAEAALAWDKCEQDSGVTDAAYWRRINAAGAKFQAALARFTAGDEAKAKKGATE